MISPAQLTLLAVAAAAVYPVVGHAAGLRRRSSSGTAVNSTTCNGKQYSYNELAGYGLIPGNARDKFGDTIGGIGSASKLVLMRRSGSERSGLLVLYWKEERERERNKYTDLTQSPWIRALGRRARMV